MRAHASSQCNSPAAQQKAGPREEPARKRFFGKIMARCAGPFAPEARKTAARRDRYERCFLNAFASTIRSGMPRRTSTAVFGKPPG